MFPVQTHEEEAEAPAEEVAPQVTEMEVAVTQAAHELEVTAQIGGRVSPVEEPAAVTEAAVEPAEGKAAADVLQVESGGEAPEEEAEMEVLAAEEAAEVPTEDTEPITETEVPLPDRPPFTQLLQRTSGTNRCFVFSRMLLLSLWKSKWWAFSTAEPSDTARSTSEDENLWFNNHPVFNPHVILLNVYRLLHRQVADAPVEEAEASVTELKEVNSHIWKHYHKFEVFASHRSEELRAVGSSAGFLSL